MQVDEAGHEGAPANIDPLRSRGVDHPLGDVHDAVAIDEHRSTPGQGVMTVEHPGVFQDGACHHDFPSRSVTRA